MKHASPEARTDSFRSGRYNLLDISRGLAAISVVFWHYQSLFYTSPGTLHPAFERSSQPLYSVFSVAYEYGFYAVMFFWVLSGFVFGAAYLGRQVSARNFFVNRFSRLYPLHFATLIIVALLQIWNFRQFGIFQIYPENDVYHFVLNLLFISHWGLQSGWSFNAPIWSVSVEIIAYAVFFFSLRPMARYGYGIALSILIASACVIASGATAVVWQCLFYFFVGNAAFFLLSRLPRVAACLGMVCIAVWVGFRHDPVAVTPFALAGLFAGIVLLLGAAETVLGDARLFRHLRWLGDSSYGIYLLHIPVMIVVMMALDLGGYDRFSLALHPLFLWAILIVTVGLAWLGFIAFERPAQRAIRRKLLADITPPPAPASPPAAPQPHRVQ